MSEPIKPSTPKLTAFQGGHPIAIKLASQPNDIVAIMYSDDNDPTFYWVERPIEYFIDDNGHCRLKRWMYLSCSTLFQVRATDILSHGEVSSSVVVLYLKAADQYYADLREQELEERDLPDSLTDAETPSDEIDESLFTAESATDEADDSVVAAKKPVVPQSQTTPKTKQQQAADARRLLHMLRNMPVTDIKH